MSKALRAAVVGVGHLGRHHARILSSIDGARLDGGGRRQRAAGAGDRVRRGRPGVDRARAICWGRSTWCRSPTPTETHARDRAACSSSRASRCWSRSRSPGRSRRPTRSSARRRRSGATLAVGHTERFNPAVMAARPAVDDPGFVEVHRLGTFPERSLDIDVVFDLMIHDLDLVLSIVQSEVESIEAVGVPVLTDRFDIANARLRFASGCVANITASRISRDRTRKIRFFQRDAYISIDTGAKEAEVYRLVRFPDRRPAIEGGKIPVPRRRTASQRAPGLRRRGPVRARAARRRRGRPARRGAGGGDHGTDGGMYTDLKAFIDDLDSARLAQASGRAREPRPRDGGRHRPGEQVARGRSGAALRAAVRLQHAGRSEPVRVARPHVPRAGRGVAGRCRA